MPSQTLQDFSSETSLHGLKYVTNSKASILRRVVWAVLFLISFGLFAGLFLLTVYNYLQYESVTLYTQIPITSFTFPTVTLCNKKFLKRGFYDDELVQQYFTHVVNPDSIYFSNKSFRESLDNKLHSITLYEVFQKYGFHIEDSVQYCLINSEYIPDCKGYFEEMGTDIGYSLVFNPSSRIDQHGNITVHKAGANGGVTLYLHTSNDEGFPALRGAGFDLAIHDPNTVPFLSEKAFTIESGHETNIALGLTKTEKLPSPYSEHDCVDKRKDPNYARENCQLQCHMEKLFPAECKAGSKSAEGCTLYHILETFRVGYSEIIRNCSLTCLQACKNAVYTQTITSSHISTKSFETFIET